MTPRDFAKGVLGLMLLLTAYVVARAVADVRGVRDELRGLDPSARVLLALAAAGALALLVLA